MEHDVSSTSYPRNLSVLERSAEEELLHTRPSHTYPNTSTALASFCMESQHPSNESAHSPWQDCDSKQNRKQNRSLNPDVFSCSCFGKTRLCALALSSFGLFPVEGVFFWFLKRKEIRGMLCPSAEAKERRRKSSPTTGPRQFGSMNYRCFWELDISLVEFDQVRFFLFSKTFFCFFLLKDLGLGGGL